MVGKLEDKVKTYKRIAENAEEMASNNLAKLRKAQVGWEETYFFHFMFVFCLQTETEVNGRTVHLSQREIGRSNFRKII